MARISAEGMVWLMMVIWLVIMGPSRETPSPVSVLTDWLLILLCLWPVRTQATVNVSLRKYIIFTLGVFTNLIAD